MPAPKPPPSPRPPPEKSPPSEPNQNSHHGSKKKKLFRRVKSVLKSFPIITTPCKMPTSAIPSLHQAGRRFHHHHHDGGGGGNGGKQMTGTLFGHRKSRINIAIQENPRCLPILVLELSINTGKLLQDMGLLGLVRIALECEKNNNIKKIKLIDEPIWTLFCNGRKSGYAVKREPTDDDLNVIQTLHATSMGAGVIPATDSGEGAELTYMRACFERVVGSKDSETYYMLSPDGNSGPELSIFFVRI